MITKTFTKKGIIYEYNVNELGSATVGTVNKNIKENNDKYGAVVTNQSLGLSTAKMTGSPVSERITQMQLRKMDLKQYIEEALKGDKLVESDIGLYRTMYDYPRVVDVQNSKFVPNGIFEFYDEVELLCARGFSSRKTFIEIMTKIEDRYPFLESELTLEEKLERMLNLKGYEVLLKYMHLHLKGKGIKTFGGFLIDLYGSFYFLKSDPCWSIIDSFGFFLFDMNFGNRYVKDCLITKFDIPEGKITIPLKIDACKGAYYCAYLSTRKVCYISGLRLYGQENQIGIEEFLAYKSLIAEATHRTAISINKRLVIIEEGTVLLARQAKELKKVSTLFHLQAMNVINEPKYASLSQVSCFIGIERLNKLFSCFPDKMVAIDFLFFLENVKVKLTWKESMEETLIPRSKEFDNHLLSMLIAIQASNTRLMSIFYKRNEQKFQNYPLVLETLTRYTDLRPLVRGNLRKVKTFNGFLV